MSALRQRHNKSDAEQQTTSVKAQKLLSKIDLYPKVQTEYVVKTEIGGQVSFITMMIMLVLFLNELWGYLQVRTVEKMHVDTSIEDKLRINYDISFFALHCKGVDINAMDVAGELQINMHNNMKKVRIDNVQGKPIELTAEEKKQQEEAMKTKNTPLSADYCGSCYGANTMENAKECCNTCQEVKDAYLELGWNIAPIEATEQCRRDTFNEELFSKPGEGCRIQGFMHVNRVFGNFHVALGNTVHRNGNLIHQFTPGEQFTYNASHIINSLSFGEPVEVVNNGVSPLDGEKKVANDLGIVYQYYLNIVPTMFVKSDGRNSSVNQFSYTEHIRKLEQDGPMNILPGVFFVFDIAQFMVQIEDSFMPFSLFLTRICAIIGGMYSMASVIDSVLYHYGRTIKRKLSKMSSTASSRRSSAEYGNTE